MISQELRLEMIQICQRMDTKGWVANHDGNVSVRLENGNLAITPGARAKYSITADEIIEIDSQGKVLNLDGRGKAFSELNVHRAAYEARSDVRAVVHAHCPSATAVGSANQEMTTAPIPEAVVSLGPGVPLVGLSLPGSEDFFREFRALLPHYDAVMVAGNGVFALGTSLEQAWLRLELVEHLATIFIRAVSLGGPRPLSAEALKALLKKRAEAGLSRPEDPQRPNWFPG